MSGSNKSLIWNTRLYTGREYDREVSLSYHRARYYDSELWRFTGRDPIWIQDNINLYTYVWNSPVGYVDTDGKKAKAAIISIFNKYYYEPPYNFWAEHGQEVVDSLERTREYSGKAWFVATPFLFFPITSPVAAWFIWATWIMSLGAGWLESYLTQDMSYSVKELTTFATAKVWWTVFQGYLKNAWAVTKVEYISELGRYMGQYANGAYWIVKNTVWQTSLALSQSVEQTIGYFTQKLIE